MQAIRFRVGAVNHVPAALVRCGVLFVDNEQRGDAKRGWQDEETDIPFMEKRMRYALRIVGKPTNHDYP